MALTKEQFGEALDLLLNDPERRKHLRGHIDRIDGPAEPNVKDEQAAKAEKILRHRLSGASDGVAAFAAEIKMPHEKGARKVGSALSDGAQAFADSIKMPAA